MSQQHRIKSHPILPVPRRREIPFTFDGKTSYAYEGEVISSALIAGGVSIFGIHHRDGVPQGIFCANGQCAQCLVLADGFPVKSCMQQVKVGMRVESVRARPELPADDKPRDTHDIETLGVKVLIIGGGPAGISAATELGRMGVPTLLIDDKHELGGKLTLQTHGFFGSVADCWAGTRGIDIAKIMSDEMNRYESVEVWLNSPAVGAFEDKKIGIVRDGKYILVQPELVLVATGAREKNLALPGCDLPGVCGAGAFQTLVNRDLVRSAEKLFIVGGGNVGLIGGYHAIQAGIEVVGLVEALPKCSGYRVHEDKLKRLGVPIWTSHTVLRVDGSTHTEKVTIAAIDNKFRPIEGTERLFDVDTVLIAVGLSPVDEIYRKCRIYGIPVWAAGDAEEIAEASAAIFSGRIAGRKILQHLGYETEIPDDWHTTGEILRSKPGGEIKFSVPDKRGNIYPVIRCVQEIPCNPCTEACPVSAIEMAGGNIMIQPEFTGTCIGCAECVVACPGLAIVLIDERADPNRKTALVTVPWEISDSVIHPGDTVMSTGFEGDNICSVKVLAMKKSYSFDRRRLLLLEVPWEARHKIAGFRILDETEPEIPEKISGLDFDMIVCRCERVTKGQIVKEIRAGARDFNQLKATVRSGMGACGGKTCTELIYRIFREEGIPLDDVTPFTLRPFLSEVPLSAFAGLEE